MRFNTLANLEICIKIALEKEMPYIGVKIQMQGFEQPEVIINPFENFETKLAYYQKAYNDDLTLKTFNGIKIIGFTYGNCYSDIEDDLVSEFEKISISKEEM